MTLPALENSVDHLHRNLSDMDEVITTLYAILGLHADGMEAAPQPASTNRLEHLVNRCDDANQRIRQQIEVLAAATRVIDPPAEPEQAAKDYVMPTTLGGPSRG